MSSDNLFKYSRSKSAIAKKHFQQACIENNVDLARKIMLRSSDVDGNYLFFCACTEGRTEIAQYIYYTLNVFYLKFSILRRTCRNGHLETIIWLLEKYPNLDIHTDNGVIFKIACKYGHLPIIKYLTTKYPAIQVNGIESKHPFCLACYNGYLEVAQWLAGYDRCRCTPTIVQLALTRACTSYRLLVAKWLTYKFPEVDINCIFVNACLSNNVESVKWLLNYFQEIDVHADNEAVFIQACQLGHRSIVNLLVDKTHGESVSYHTVYRNNRHAEYICSDHPLGEVWKHRLVFGNVYVYHDECCDIRLMIQHTVTQ